jgi:hypothetical protein
MRRLFIICLLALSATALLVSAPAASAATSAKASKPSITRVLPMRVSVGNVLTIRGRNFKAKRRANTVIFRGPNGRSVFAKPRRASRGALSVVVPGAVSRLLRGSLSNPQPTRLKLRVLARRFSAFTSRRLSPVVVPAKIAPRPGGTGVGAGAAGCPGQDFDGDLLSNGLEMQLKLDPCLADTDGDSVEDGYEYQSALDLNHYARTPSLPYPGKRPYPNPLDPADGTPIGTDYDGDGLLLREEFVLWLSYARDGSPRPSHPLSLGGLIYSDGLQKSVDSPPPANPGGLLGWALEIDGDGVLSDDERDADADGLGNWDEIRGAMVESWWLEQYDGRRGPKESKYPGIDFLDNEDTAPAYNAYIDPDMDGDGVFDGSDDNDHDGLSNQFEVRRPEDWEAQAITGFPLAANPWAYTHPFNPCKPFNSERCHRHPPFDYYKGDQVPPVGPTPPAGYPDARPVTPNG